MVEANPEILSGLQNYVASKTGGKPPIGGDKGKDTSKAAPAPPAKIPLPDFNDPVARLKYVDAIRQQYNLPHGYGDTFLHLNEIPKTQTDSLTAKQIAIKAAKTANIPAPLLYSSSMVEGMSGLYPYGKNQDVDWSGNAKYPVNGFTNFGLDTFADAYPGLVKKGYLPADFNNQFVKAPNKNEKGQVVNSANFASAESAMQAKAAMLRNSQDEITSYAAQNKIPLSDKAKQFFSLVHYNAGAGNAQKMLSDYQKAGALNNDAFLTQRPTTGPGLNANSWKEPYDNVNLRFQLANALTNQENFNPTAPPAATVTTPITNQ